MTDTDTEEQEEAEANLDFNAFKNAFEDNDVVGLILAYMSLGDAVNIIKTCKAFRTLPPMLACLEDLIVAFRKTIETVKHSAETHLESIKLDRESQEFTGYFDAEESEMVLLQSRAIESVLLENIKIAKTAQLCVMRAKTAQLCVTRATIAGDCELVSA